MARTTTAMGTSTTLLGTTSSIGSHPFLMGSTRIATGIRLPTRTVTLALTERLSPASPEPDSARCADGGAIFLGDVRSLPLLESYHAALQSYKAAPEETRSDLAQRVAVQAAREQELAVAPAFFHALQRLLPRIAKLKVGPGTDPDAEMGPLVTRQHWEKVKGYIDLGVEEGAELGDVRLHGFGSEANRRDGKRESAQLKTQHPRRAFLASGRPPAVRCCRMLRRSQSPPNLRGSPLGAALRQNR